MASDALYLREDVYFEPLFNSWYAWPHLLPPATAARHVVRTHRRIMSSFVQNAALHVLALKDKKMLGSEFLNCREQDVQAIEALLADMDRRCGKLVALSAALDSLEEMLRSHTNGVTLEPLYRQLPEPLRGYVELFFDMEHRASYRLLEALLYRSEYYDESLQSISFGLLSRVQKRPFVLSTPRLPDADHVRIATSFTDPDIDAIAGARQVPITRERLETLFAQRERATGSLSLEALFTTEAPARGYEPVRSGVRLRYLGHAGLMLESPEVSIMIDPVIANVIPDASTNVYGYAQLPPRVDFICLTHNHQDHVHFESLLQLRHKVGAILVPKNNGGTVADPSMRLMLRQLGFEVFEHDDLDATAIPGGRIVAFPFLGEHGDLNIRSKTAWYIELLGRRFLFAADSSNLDDTLYKRMAQLFPKPDVLALGMECVGAPYTWLYGALYSQKISKAVKESRRLNGSDAAQALSMVKALGAREVYVYAMGMEPWYEYFMGLAYEKDAKQLTEARRLIADCADIGIEARLLFGSHSVSYPHASIHG